MSKYKTNIRHNSPAFKSWLLPLLLFMLLPVTASAFWSINDNRTKQETFDYILKVNGSGVAVVDNNVVVSLQLTAIQDVPFSQSVVISPELVDTATLHKAELPLIFLNSRNQQVYFERHLKNEYPDAIALRKKNGEDLKIDYLRSVKYEPWMDHAVLNLRKASCACRNQKDRGEEIIELFPKKEGPVEIQLFPVYKLPPADNSVKVREEKGSAYLCFVVDKWDILPNYMDNPRELEKIHNSINIVKNDSNVTIKKMSIEGYASPEGSYSHNVKLSENRTEALKTYLQKTGKTKGIRLEARGKGENWDGFLKYLRNNNQVPQRSKLLNIATSKASPDEKEKRMRKEAGEGYAYVLKNVFPSLRCTNYAVEYTVRPFTLEESEVVFETRPINLNLNEIYRLADKYFDNEQKYYSIMRKAYLLYPEDSYINLTMAYLSIKKGEVNEAINYLKKVKDCPEKTMDEGLIAYLQGDFAKAIQLVEEAQRQGLPDATHQLEEFKKLTNNK